MSEVLLEIPLNDCFVKCSAFILSYGRIAYESADVWAITWTNNDQLTYECVTRPKQASLDLAMFESNHAIMCEKSL